MEKFCRWRLIEFTLIKICKENDSLVTKKWKDLLISLEIKGIIFQSPEGIIKKVFVDSREACKNGCWGIIWSRSVTIISRKFSSYSTKYSRLFVMENKRRRRKKMGGRRFDYNTNQLSLKTKLQL